MNGSNDRSDVLTRRALLARAGATGLAAFAAQGLLAACTSPQPGGQVGASTAPSSAARSGGRVVYAYGNEPVTVDPQKSGAYETWQYDYRVYDRLTTLDATGKVVGSLAASWTQPSPTTYVFKLRDNVRFSNGRQMKASDVVKSFQRYYDPKISGAALKPGPLKEVKALDDLTVQFDLALPHPPFLALIARGSTSILPMQELEAGTFDPNKDWLGTGPFMVKEILKGEQWTFARNPYYWRPNLPQADELVMLIIPDQSARIAALRTGRADVAYLSNLDAPQLLKDVPNVKTVVQTTSELNSLIFNARTPTTAALKDQRVRQALSLCVDRDQVIRVALGGNGKPAYGTIPGTPDECDGSKLPKRDIAKAKSLLAEAGATGFSFQIYSYTTDEAGLRIAQVLQQQFAEAGVNAKLQTLETGVLLAKFGFSTDPATGDAFTTYPSGYGDNWSELSLFSTAVADYSKKYQLDDPTYDGLLDKARTAQPGAERAGIYQQMCGRVAETVGLIPLAPRFNTVAYRSDRIDAAVPAYESHGDYVRFIAEYSVKAR